MNANIRDILIAIGGGALIALIAIVAGAAIWAGVVAGVGFAVVFIVAQQLRRRRSATTTTK